jgi:lysophospholipase L1-like esterase
MISKKMITLLLCGLLTLSLIASCTDPQAANAAAVETAAPVTVPSDKAEAYTMTGTWTSDDEQTVVPLTLHLYEDGTLVLECHENKAGSWEKDSEGKLHVTIGQDQYLSTYSDVKKSYSVRIEDKIGDEEISVALSEPQDANKIAEENNQALIQFLEKGFANEAPVDIPSGAVVFYGGSNFVKWATLEKDLSGYPVVNRSIGGSNDPIRRHFFAERVQALAPAAVFYMSSSNDWTSGQNKDDIKAYKQEFFDEMAKALPDTFFVILSATPNPLRYFGEYHDGMVEVDAFTEEYCRTHERFFFLNVVPALSLSGGASPNPDLWQSDRLHLNSDGYALLTDLVREELEKLKQEGLQLSESLGIEEDGEQQKAVWVKDWETFEHWTEEDFSGKETAYQLIGTWSMEGDYPMTFHLLLNLYRDGSAVVYQHSPTRGDFHYFGYWTERDLEQGHRISLTMRFETSDNGLIEHPYSYRFFVQPDGTCTFSYDFGIIPGSYLRAADLTGSTAVLFANETEFASAMDR